MYSLKFLPQLDAFARDLWGNSYIDPKGISGEMSRRYSPHPKMKIIPCEEDTNGEYVPIRDTKKVNSEL